LESQAHRPLASFLSVDRKVTTDSPTFHTANVVAKYKNAAGAICFVDNLATTTKVYSFGFRDLRKGFRTLTSLLQGDIKSLLQLDFERSMLLDKL